MSALRNERGRIGTVGDALILLLVLAAIAAWWVTQRNKPRTAPMPAAPAPIASAPPPLTVPSQDSSQAPSLVASPSSLPSGQLRPFAPGSLPGSQHAAALEAIHGLIERGQDTEAESRLAALPPEALDNDQIRQAVAVL